METGVGQVREHGSTTVLLGDDVFDFVGARVERLRKQTILAGKTGTALNRLDQGIIHDASHHLGFVRRNLRALDWRMATKSAILM